MPRQNGNSGGREGNNISDRLDFHFLRLCIESNFGNPQEAKLKTAEPRPYKAYIKFIHGASSVPPPPPERTDGWTEG